MIFWLVFFLLDLQVSYLLILFLPVFQKTPGNAVIELR